MKFAEDTIAHVSADARLKFFFISFSRLLFFDFVISKSAQGCPFFHAKEYGASIIVMTFWQVYPFTRCDYVSLKEVVSVGL